MSNEGQVARNECMKSSGFPETILLHLGKLAFFGLPLGDAKDAHLAVRSQRRRTADLEFQNALLDRDAFVQGNIPEPHVAEQVCSQYPGLITVKERRIHPSFVL